MEKTLESIIRVLKHTAFLLKKDIEEEESKNNDATFAKGQLNGLQIAIQCAEEKYKDAKKEL
jgi:hypothetical protein